MKTFVCFLLLFSLTLSTASRGSEGIESGSLLENAEGSLLEKAEGTLIENAEGSLIENADGSLIENADGSYLRIQSSYIAHAEHSDIRRYDDLSWTKTDLPFKSNLSLESVQFFVFKIPLVEYLSLVKGDCESNCALYISHHSFDIEVYLNRQLLASRVNKEGHPVMAWNRPLLVDIPSNYHEGQLIFVLKNAKPFAMLPEVLIGHHQVLNDMYLKRYFLQIKVSEWGSVLSIVMGLFGLLLWLKRREDVHYAFFSLLCFSWSAVLFYLYLPISPLESGTWLKVAYFFAELSGVFLFFFISLFLESYSKKIAALSAFLCVLTILVYVIFPLHEAHYMMMFMHLYTTGLVIFALYKSSHSAYYKGLFEAKVISIGLGLVMLLVSIDIVRFGVAASTWSAPPELTFMQHGVLFLLITFFLLIVKRFNDAIDESKALNESLEHQVSTAKEQLREHYEESKRLELGKVAEEERQALMRDLHDDLGAKLFSIVSSSDSNEKTELGREALISMKDLVAQANDRNNDLNAAIISSCSEMEARLKSKRMDLLLDRDPSLDEITVAPQTCYHLRRIIREATTNILKHSHASSVFVQYRFGTQLELKISDNGVGMDLDNVAGNGLRNIRYRVQQLNGCVDISSKKNGGVSIELNAPIEVIKE